MSGINLSVMESIRDNTGAALPNRYTILSDDITQLKHENQHITVTSINAAMIPYIIDSNVNGFPDGKYVSIVTP